MKSTRAYPVAENRRFHHKVNNAAIRMRFYKYGDAGDGSTVVITGVTLMAALREAW